MPPVTAVTSARRVRVGAALGAGLHGVLAVLCVVASSTDPVFAWLAGYAVAGAAASTGIAWAAGDTRALPWRVVTGLLLVTAVLAVLAVLEDPVAGIIVAGVGLGSLLVLQRAARAA